MHLRLPGQGAPRTRSTCCGRTAPRSWSARPPSTPSTRSRTTTCPTGWCARRRAPGSPTSTPTRTTRARTTRPPAPSCGSRPTGGSPTSSRASAPAARSPAPAATSRRSATAAVQVIGADPEGSVYSGGSGRPYLVEGVGEDFWPTAYDRTVADEIVAVSDKDSFQMTRRLAKEEGLLVGGSCGMAVVAALRGRRARLGAGRRRRRAAARQRPRLPVARSSTTSGWPTTASWRTPARAPRSPTCCAHKAGGHARTLVHMHPDETVGEAIEVLREYGVSQMPVVKPAPGPPT